MTSNGYFLGASGTRYTYAEIADRISKKAPHTLGKHIFVQLKAIGLLDELTSGTTPCSLPYSFAEADALDECSETTPTIIAEATCQASPALRPPIIIEVRGGIVQDVLNVPPGVEYEIRDYDNQEETNWERKQYDCF